MNYKDFGFCGAPATEESKPLTLDDVHAIMECVSLKNEKFHGLEKILFYNIIKKEYAVTFLRSDGSADHLTTSSLQMAVKFYNDSI
jgi:hypothetical protein